MRAWLGRNRRLSKDYEALPKVSEAFVYAAMVRLMLQRLYQLSIRQDKSFELSCQTRAAIQT
jgi:hypothetical protein